MLITCAIVIISLQCFGNQETYSEALRKCTNLKTMSERNVCRMHVTERYRNLPDEDIKDETFYIPEKLHKHVIYGEIVDFKEIFKGVEE